MDAKEEYQTYLKEVQEQGVEFNNICEKAEKAIEKYYIEGDALDAITVCQALLKLKGEIDETTENLVKLEEQYQKNLWVNKDPENNKWQNFMNQ